MNANLMLGMLWEKKKFQENESTFQQKKVDKNPDMGSFEFPKISKRLPPNQMASYCFSLV